MICELLRRGIGYIFRSALKYLDRTVSRAMGCFFACFRVREDRSSRPPVLVSSTPREVVVSKNPLSSLFLSEERKDLPCAVKEGDSLGSPQINKELIDEAMFLKGCGTLPETPCEIRIATQKFTSSPVVNKDFEDFKFHSWLPSATITKSQLSEPVDQAPDEVKLRQDWPAVSVSSENAPDSCISDVRTAGRISISSNDDSEAACPRTVSKVNLNQNDDTRHLVTPAILTTNHKSGNKSVRFDCDYSTSSSKGSSSGYGCQTFKKSESPEDLRVLRASPKPTPLKLSDEMQTPGTVFPATVDMLADKKTRIRSQYVYPVLKPVENYSQLKPFTGDGSDSNHMSAELREPLEQLEIATPISEVGVKDSSSMKDGMVQATLSSWLKPPTRTCDDNNLFVTTAAGKNIQFGKSPSDRPILGMVAAHWNDNDSSHISPKWWDGNGIPNSTNKYKEDQKVSWHATPFEERLEKALSEESFVTQKKYKDGSSTLLVECEESDTALSHMQVSAHSKSVITV